MNNEIKIFDESLNKPQFSCCSMMDLAGMECKKKKKCCKSYKKDKRCKSCPKR